MTRVRLVTIDLLAVLGLALFVGSATTQLSCRSPALAVAALAIFDCEQAHFDAKMFADAELLARADLQHLLADAPRPDTAVIKAELAPIRSDLGRCAFAGVVAAASEFLAPTTASGDPEQPESDPVGQLPTSQVTDPAELLSRARLAARELGWAPLRTSSGVF